MSITEEHIKENLSKAYVEAVIARAGYGYAESKNDYGIDGTIKEVIYNKRRKTIAESGFNLDFQLKSTVNAVIRDGNIVYDLKAKDYHDLIDNESATQRILILYIMPANPKKWLNNSSKYMLMRTGAWWVSLKGEKEVDNNNTVRIKIPISHFLSVTELKRIMQCVKEGNEL